MWISNENFHETKVVYLEKLCKIGIQHFLFEPQKIEKILVYREVPELLEIANEPLPSSPPPLLSAAEHHSPPAYGGCRPCSSGPPADLKHVAWHVSWLPHHLPRALGLLVMRHAALPCAAPPFCPPPHHRARPGLDRPPPGTINFALKPSSL